MACNRFQIIPAVRKPSKISFFRHAARPETPEEFEQNR
jgi:hypothetical protein